MPHRTNMRNSDATRNLAAAILDQVTGLIDEQLMVQQIDEPIDRALASFGSVEHEPYSHPRFTETTARFVKHVFDHALSPGRRLTVSQARDETTALLGLAYRGTYAIGYHGAILDAADPSDPGLELVLARIAELIKSERRQLHLRCVEFRYIDSADWPTRCAMASLLIERCREHLPPELRSCPPEQLADDVFDLLALHLATARRLRPTRASSWWA